MSRGNFVRAERFGQDLKGKIKMRLARVAAPMESVSSSKGENPFDKEKQKVQIGPQTPRVRQVMEMNGVTKCKAMGKSGGSGKLGMTGATRE